MKSLMDGGSKYRPVRMNKTSLMPLYQDTKRPYKD